MGLANTKAMRFWFVLCCVACAATPPPSINRFTARGLETAGLSGSTRDDHGTIWAVAERRAQLFRFASDGTAPDLVVGIQGVPQGLELESMAWLDTYTLAIGTEVDRPRASDDIVIVQIEGTTARVIDRWTLPWSAWSIEAPANSGIEGLCSTGSYVVAAGEPVLEEGGARWAPIARMKRQGLTRGPWTPFRLKLTTATGKISSLDCWGDDDELELYAVERHYGVARVLYFEVPTHGGGRDLAPTTVVDLAKLIPRLPNIEGVARRNGHLVIVTDHDENDKTGATETILLGPFDEDD